MISSLLAAAQVAGSGGGAAGPATPITSDAGGPKGPIVVNPVGVNLGEMLKPFSDSLYNGGFGFEAPNRITETTLARRPSSTPSTVVPVQASMFNPLWIGIGALAVGAYVYFLRMKG